MRAHSPFKVRFCAVAGARRHRHRVRLSHHAPGRGLQLPVDSFHSHEARLALWAPNPERDGEPQNRGIFFSFFSSFWLNELLLLLATINNLQHASSHVCTTLCANTTAAVLQLVVHPCSANIYRLGPCSALQSVTLVNALHEFSLFFSLFCFVFSKDIFISLFIYFSRY